ncbi:MAG TPA: sensor histidine kinase [Anaerolineales bacterium]|nr:sensor histidine kinase [Anaerolineales bacterium]
MAPTKKNKSPSSSQTLYWRFDAHTFSLLGRELITDRITAVFELVKNSYDANATEVTVGFHNVTSHSKDRRITIRDNGLGMSLKDIKDKWMVVGTRSKRVKLISPPPFNRRHVGEKGIGRFAVDKLGERLTIRTKTKGVIRRLVVEIDWKAYERASRKKKTVLFTDIENKYAYEKANKTEHGTELIIADVREEWTKNDIDRLYKELTKIVSPFSSLSRPFRIFVDSNEHNDYQNKEVITDAVNYSSANQTIGFDCVRQKQEVLRFNESTGQIVKREVAYRSFGPVSMTIYYFDEQGKKQYNAAHRKDGSRIDGIKVYRDGIVTTPFAEFEADPDRKRDILGIDKRLWSHSFDKVGTRELLGLINISKTLNPQIIDATNRQDFIDTPEYRDFKEFIIEQIDAFSKLKIARRSKSNLEKATALRRAAEAVLGFSQTIAKIEIRNPKLKRTLAPLKKEALEVQKALRKGIHAQEETQKEFVQKENIYLSLMSLQDYAIHISHAVRTSLGKIMRRAEYFQKHFPNPRYDQLFKKYVTQILQEMQTLSRVIDFMLSYAGSNVELQEFNIKSVVEDLLLVDYKTLFDDENISTTVEIRDDFTVSTNKIFIQDIIQNLISNSIKALQSIADKKIKCTGYVEGDAFFLLFSDNGCGIRKDAEDKIFDMYYTTTAEQGGAGLGLYIVKTRIEALKGTIQLVQAEFDRGASFLLKLPFNGAQK